MNKSWLKYSILSIFILIIISFIVSIWTPTLNSFRIIFGSFYLLFLPGFVWSWFFWKKDQISAMERLIISLVLSISIVPLTIYLLNLTGIKINLISSVIEIAFIILVGITVQIFASKKALAK